MGFSPNKSVLDLEMVIEGERRKGREVKEKIEYELDNERKTRIEFENKLIRAREELQKKDLLISELDFKANDFENENNSLRQENEGLKEELDRLNDYCEAHQRDLEEKLVMQSRKMMAMEQGFRDQVNLLKEQSLEELDRVTCDLENRNKILEEKLRGILNGKNQAEEEVKKLADLLKRSRMEAEEHIKEVVIRVQEDEYRKFMANMKALENKLRASEETRDLLGKKVQEQSKILNELSRKLEETEIDSQNNISRLKQDKSDMENQLRQADIMVSKYRNELSAKENLNSRMEAELIEMQKIIHQQKERSRGEVENVLKEVYYYKLGWK